MNRELTDAQRALVNPSYRPKPSELGAECRRVMNLRLDAEARTRKPALPAPQIEHTPESRARIAAMADAYVQRASEHMRTGTPSAMLVSATCPCEPMPGSDRT